MLTVKQATRTYSRMESKKVKSRTFWRRLAKTDLVEVDPALRSAGLLEDVTFG